MDYEEIVKKYVLLTETTIVNTVDDDLLNKLSEPLETTPPVLLTAESKMQLQIDDNETMEEFEKMLERNTYVLEDDMAFPKASVDPNLLRLRTDVMDFITNVILKHESEFYQLLIAHFPEQVTDIMCNTNKSIIDMIFATTNKFYNKLYLDVQNKDTSNPTVTLINDMCSYSKIHYHCLLDTLVRLTVDVHLDVVREQLSIKDTDSHQKTVMNQVNTYYLNTNLLHILSHDCNAKGHVLEFPVLQSGENAFEICMDAFTSS